MSVWILLELMMMEVVVTTGHAKLQSNHHLNESAPSFLQVRCPSSALNQQC